MFANTVNLIIITSGINRIIACDIPIQQTTEKETLILNPY